MSTEKLLSKIETLNFKELRSTLFLVSMRDCENNPEEWKETELREDILEIYSLLNDLESINTKKTTTCI